MLALNSCLTIGKWAQVPFSSCGSGHFTSKKILYILGLFVYTDARRAYRGISIYILTYIFTLN